MLVQLEELYLSTVVEDKVQGKALEDRVRIAGVGDMLKSVGMVGEDRQTEYGHTPAEGDHMQMADTLLN